MPVRLLVIASDAGLQMTLARWLVPAGYAIESAEGPGQALRALQAAAVTVAIFRVEQWDVATFAVARELRGTRCGLVAIVDSVNDIGRLRRFGFVPDLCLAQPLKASDVVEGIEAVVHSADGNKEVPIAGETIDVHGMTLDVPGHLLIDASGREVKLTRGELAILVALARRRGQVVSRDRLLDAVSGRSADVFDRSIDNLIARLRHKIEPNPRRPRLIITVCGAGYKLSDRDGASNASSPSVAVPHRRSVLLLPFANPGGAAELSHSAAAISTILIAELRHVVGVQVLCRHDDGVDALESVRQLGVQYVVRGSIRRSGDDVRIDAQMVDANTGVPV
jgi:DNA-binding response OmpR family regulator/TolB-like protein